MKKFTKLLSLLLAVVMMLGLAACGSNGTTETAAPTAADVSAETKADTAAAPTAPNRAILGSVTELSGDFRYPGWGGSSAGASDQDIQKLTIGYGTMETNQGGAYVWNETAVKDHTETDNDDGTATYTVTINEGLTFSDGTPITAANYLAQVMAFSTPVAVAAGMPGTMGQSFVGYKEFNAYTGEEAEGTSKIFSGIRLLDEYTFSVTVSSNYLPYYFAYTYAALDPSSSGPVAGRRRGDQG